MMKAEKTFCASVGFSLRIIFIFRGIGKRIPEPILILQYWIFVATNCQFTLLNLPTMKKYTLHGDMPAEVLRSTAKVILVWQIWMRRKLRKKQGSTEWSARLHGYYL